MPVLFTVLCLVLLGPRSDSESIFVFLHEPEAGLVSTGIQVPYTCITNDSSSYVSTYVVSAIWSYRWCPGEDLVWNLGNPLLSSRTVHYLSMYCTVTAPVHGQSMLQQAVGARLGSYRSRFLADRSSRRRQELLHLCVCPDLSRLAFV